VQGVVGHESLPDKVPDGVDGLLGEAAAHGFVQRTKKRCAIAMEECDHLRFAADETLIATVFRSTLPEGERLSVEQLVDEICRAGRRARHVGGADHIIDTIIAERRPGDVVVIMSNGGFDNIHRRLLARLRESGQPQTEGAA